MVTMNTLDGSTTLLQLESKSEWLRVRVQNMDWSPDCFPWPSIFLDSWLEITGLWLELFTIYVKWQAAVIMYTVWEWQSYKSAWYVLRLMRMKKFYVD